MRVGKKLRGEEALITEYSGVRLRMDLDRVPLGRGDHVGLKQLWSDYSQYLYLPRLRDSAVLLEAVLSGIGLLTWSADTFGYASAFDEGTGRYSGLVGGENAAVVLDATSVLVKPEVAARQLDEERQRTAGPTAAAGQQAGTGTTDKPSAGSGLGSRPQTQPSAPKRFYGRVVVEPVRMCEISAT